MLIRWKKVDGGAVLTVIREDGSLETTRPRQGAFFAVHDLVHYVVEAAMGFNEAFFGLLRSGWSYETFEDKTDPRYQSIPSEATVAEHLVGVLTTRLLNPARLDGELASEWVREINETVAQMLEPEGLSAPHLDHEGLLAMAASLEVLLARWRDLPLGEHLQLEFPSGEDLRGTGG